MAFARKHYEVYKSVNTGICWRGYSLHWDVFSTSTYDAPRKQANPLRERQRDRAGQRKRPTAANAALRVDNAREGEGGLSMNVESLCGSLFLSNFFL